MRFLLGRSILVKQVKRLVGGGTTSGRYTMMMPCGNL